MQENFTKFIRRQFNKQRLLNWLTPQKIKFSKKKDARHCVERLLIYSVGYGDSP